LDLRKQILARVSEGSDDPRFPPSPQRIVRDLRRALPDDGIVALDNGMYKIWFALGYRTHLANTILLDNALATMGAGLTTAPRARACSAAGTTLAFPLRTRQALAPQSDVDKRASRSQAWPGERSQSNRPANRRSGTDQHRRRDGVLVGFCDPPAVRRCGFNARVLLFAFALTLLVTALLCRPKYGRCGLCEYALGEDTGSLVYAGSAGELINSHPIVEAQLQ
jgi:hypothetical protein